MKRIIYVVIFVILTGTYHSACKKDAPMTNQSGLFVIQTTIGNVKIISDQQALAASIGQVIAKNSTIKVGPLSLIDIKLGKLGIIRINQNSNVKVAKLLKSLNKVDTMLEIKKGSLFITISKLKKESNIRIKTPTTIASVRGTTFKVSVGEKKSRIDVLAGKVKVNPVRDGEVVEKIEQIVETNNRVELDEESVKSIIENKKEITVIALQEKEIADIKQEAKYIKIDDTINKEVLKEIKEIGIESKVIAEIKNNKTYETELIENIKIIDDKKKERSSTEKIEEEKKKQIKEVNQKARKAQALKKVALEEEKRIAEEKLAAEKLENERLEKERLAKEAAALKKKKEEEKKEKRVKNVPNF